MGSWLSPPFPGGAIGQRPRERLPCCFAADPVYGQAVSVLKGDNGRLGRLAEYAPDFCFQVAQSTQRLLQGFNVSTSGARVQDAGLGGFGFGSARSALAHG